MSEERGPYTMIKPQAGYHGVDELAARLGVGAATKGDGGEIFIIGRSGTNYNLMELIERLLDRLDAAT